MAIETLTPAHGLLGAYAAAFLATALMAVPPILLVVLLWRMQKRTEVH
jgi:PAT family beta-lactamase induction signal transducer AmpG